MEIHKVHHRKIHLRKCFSSATEFWNFDTREGGGFQARGFFEFESRDETTKFVVLIRALLDCSEWIVVISVGNLWRICVGQGDLESGSPL